MAPTSEDGVRDLAIQLCSIITLARLTPPAHDTMLIAKHAGRIVTECMKLAPGVTVIPPIVLSCAMELSDCSKKDGAGIEIARVPNWGAIGYDDRRIMRHPQHQKAMAWMTDKGPDKIIEAVKVLKDGIDWQVIILSKAADQRDAQGQHQDVAGASTSHQLPEEEAVEQVATTRIPKLRSFGPATKKTVSGKGKGIEREKGDAESCKDNDEEMATTTAPQRRSNERGRKRRRTSYAGAEYDETLDHDFQMEGMSESSNKRLGTIYVSGGVRDDQCALCKQRGLKCTPEYSTKTGHRLASCASCHQKKTRCSYDNEPETVTRSETRARPRAKSVLSSKRARSPAASSPTSREARPSPPQSGRSINMGSPEILTSILKPSSTSSIPDQVDTTENRMEARMIALEAGLSKVFTVMDGLGKEHETLRQKVITKHPTFPIPRAPSQPVAQTPISEPFAGETQVTPSRTLPSGSPPSGSLPAAITSFRTLPLRSSPDRHSSAMPTPVRINTAQSPDDVMDFGVIP
ncbi:hypothetical protein CY34DRAFT_110331 [Suillus luteus UH-Slu-Lm8-n1]|uniref:Zn(2)-C6 fungal-type domain-containing protein n=1 Tax=Suillus luteus UH-Slu-Lm8-n1 TaxID=930992 RepID=A0A0D0A835_9AGAM|nr:hypothetical protein CY34DRAFT_110331 [Suillus luteus UH-Slu-Lm8-n1]